jgi:hypothetical protein
MKQSVLLALMLTFVACANRSENDDENSLTSRFKSTMNIHERIERGSDGVITYSALPWGGLVGSMKEHNLPVDWSGYEAVTIDFAEPTKVETQLLVSDRYKAYGKSGISSLTCNFDGQDVSSVDEVTLQAADSGTIKVKEVRLTPVTGTWKTVPLRTINCEFGDWQNGFMLKPELFEHAQVGDKLEFLYTTDTSNPDVNNWLIKTVVANTETSLEGNSDALNKWGCAPVGRRSTVYRIPLTATDIKNLKEKGTFVNGRYINMKQCNLLQPDHTVGTDGGDDRLQEY